MRTLLSALTAGQGLINSAMIVPSMMGADVLSAVNLAFIALQTAIADDDTAGIQAAQLQLCTYIELTDTDANLADGAVAAAVSAAWGVLASLIADWAVQSETLPRMVRRVGGKEATKLAKTGCGCRN